jgi:hypothetical protein
MIQFTSRLKKEVDAEIERIEHTEVNLMMKSLEASRVLREAYSQLKAFVLLFYFNRLKFASRKRY